MSYHNAGASTSVLGRGNYLTSGARRVSRVSPRLAGPPQLVAPVLGRGVADYGFLEVRPEDQALAGPSLVPPRLIAPVLGSRFGDYGYLEVRPEDQMMGFSTGGYVSGLDGARSRGNRWGMQYPSRVDGVFGGLGDDAKKAALARAQSFAAFPPSFWSTLNADFSRVLRPANGAIDAIGILSAGDRTKLKTRPLDFFIDLFDPIEDLVAAAIARVNARTGKTMRTFFGVRVDMRYNRPGDERYDVPTLNLVRRLRVIQQFMALMVLDPVNLGIEIVGGALAESPLGRSMQSRTLAVAPTTGSLPSDAALIHTDADGTKRFFSQSTQRYFDVRPGSNVAVRETTRAPGTGPSDLVLRSTDNGVMHHFSPSTRLYYVTGQVLHGLGGLGRVRGGPRGLGGVAVDDAVEAAVPPAAEAASFTGVPWLDTVLASIAGAALTAVTGAVTVAVTNTVNNAFKPSASQTTVPTKVPPPSAPPPVVIRPSGGSVPQASGFPVAAVGVAAAVLLFMGLSARPRRRGSES